jgi:beta-glucuronidase
VSLTARDLPPDGVLTLPVMRPFRLILATLVALVATASPALAVDTPAKKTLYADGPTGRYLVDGAWQFRLDAANQGLRQRWQRRTATTGWTAVEVPNAWNVGDDSPASMAGSIGWYRKDFRLPETRQALQWALRFESVNYRMQAWLNGKRLGSHAGAYLPFTLRIRAGLQRRGVNRLVVRVDSRRATSDFPPAGKAASGVPTGGWWNYGGITREVYLVREDRAAIESVVVRPIIRCSACDARVQLSATVRSADDRSVPVSVSGVFNGRRRNLGSGQVGPGTRTFEGNLTVRKPHLWSPADPHLYPAALEVRSGGRLVARWTVHSGVRSIRARGGRLFLNFRPVDLRGVGIHEDTRARGFAVDNAFRERLVADARALGATVLRTHYPMAPYMHELADREGLLVWSEIPVYAVKTPVLARRSVRDRAVRLLAENITANQNHPSVFVWSIANELSSKPGPSQGTYIAKAAELAHALDPTRPVAQVMAAFPDGACEPEYAPLDVMGFNEYFGWYPGVGGSTFDRRHLSAYLDHLHECYPDKALLVTEFGAEANRPGPAEEKGTWAFQQDFVNYHLGVFATKPWLNGALYWTLNEFRVRPEWEGGNPRPTSPIHQKALITYDGQPKPAFADVQRWYRGTQQFGAAGE